MKETILSEVKTCPVCGAPSDAFHKDGHYDRDFICYESNTYICHRITICCVECSSCGHSHALEPSVIVPHCSYSISFLLHLMYAKLTNAFPTIDALCFHFGISVSTYYRIYKRFITDFTLMKQLKILSQTLDLWNQHTDNFHDILHRYFEACGHSFLQPRVRLRPKLFLNTPPTDISRYIDNGLSLP